ncbi:carbohydrate kinase [Streptacidiphilus sp. PB12-B1b]|uniref:carbohydrate kinase family protein n=1 Tax=Streptacidiphilus sp. PB12-B1b TaxID=2705012 RepID=UPI0015FAC6AE|nr:carbohydrate kinase [Streptacidiphilus sp. PB12-B1b]QMU76735.1 carbohydrate kinase [Streptacidiphilus sp. PB12-B1b]
MQSTPPPTLVVGEALTDILVDPGGRRQAHPGGSPVNVALGVARLGHPVQLATRVGTDPFGEALQRHLRDGGVRLTEGSVVDAPTSTATATLDARGAAAYRFDITWSLPPSATAPARTGAVAHLHTGSIATALEPGAAQVRAAVEAARATATVSYDPNIRPPLLRSADGERPGVEALVAAADVVKASDEDLAWLYPGRDPREAAAAWARSGPALVVLTRGAEGATAFWDGGLREVPPIPVRVVDTVGAGDAFMAGLISGLLQAGMLGPGPAPRARLRAAVGRTRAADEVVAALSLAARAAAVTCTRPGADPPSREQLRAGAGAATGPVGGR